VVSAGLLAAAGGALVACSSEGLDPGESGSKPSATDSAALPQTNDLPRGYRLIDALAEKDRALYDRIAEPTDARLRVHGNRLIPEPTGSAAMDISFELGALGPGSVSANPIANPDQKLVLQPVAAREIQPVGLPDGRAVYEGLWHQIDMVVTASHNRLRTTLVIDDETAPNSLTWLVDLPSTLKQKESSRNQTSLVDSKGYERLKISQAVLIGADGTTSELAVRLEADGLARLDYDPRNVAFPAVISFDIDAPPVAMLVVPPELIKARMMVLLDTSGSMLDRFDSGTSGGGDSDATAVFCDNNIGTAFACSSNVSCTIANGGVDTHKVSDPANPSRMLGAKLALSNVVNAHSSVLDFGLMRFREAGSCTDQKYCSPSTTGSFNWARRYNDGTGSDYASLSLNNIPDGCVMGSPCDSGTCLANADGLGHSACTCSGNNNTGHAQCDGGSGFDDDSNDCDGQNGTTRFCRFDGLNLNLTYSGACGSDGAGGRVLVSPSATSSQNVRKWVDFVEDTCSSTGVAGGAPRNPELRAGGFTPLAWSIESAQSDWYQPIYNVSKVGLGTYNTSSPLYDAKLDCRPYVLVVMTDGDDSCAASTTNDPPAAVAALNAVNTANRVKVYTMGMGNTGGLNTAVLDNMMTQGGSGKTVAPIAANQTQIETAFADIVADTVKFEQCNGLDDNCNDRIDEGLNVYQDCETNAQCGSGTCNKGRCTCSGGNDAQCTNGYSCAADNFCRPSCFIGSNACLKEGVRKCGGTCCVDDGQASCTPLTPGTGSPEVCNGQDDNCNGQIDEGFPNGCPSCTPTAEICNGKDDDCDGKIDSADPDLIGIGGPCGTTTGICEPGIVQCQSGAPVCVPAQGPLTEVCNGLDDDCNGATDGQTRTCYKPGGANPAGCTFSNGTWTCEGICRTGTETCAAQSNGVTGTPGVECNAANCWSAECTGQQIPTTEICNGLDDDCDGSTDEGIPALPPASTPVTGDQCCKHQAGGDDLCGVGVCGFGTYKCSGAQVVCDGGQGPTGEICDGLDNDCNGEVDDIPGLGDACAAAGCGGTKVCEQVDSEWKIYCKPNGMGTAEVCNGVDDDCDGSVDELPDVEDNDPDHSIGTDCNEPPADQSEAPCKPGKWTCDAGIEVCKGDVQPGVEVCNGLDDDCDGEADSPEPCPAGSACIAGECAPPCGGGEFPCPGGFKCEDGYCVSIGGGSGGSGNGSGSGSGSGGSSVSSGGSNSSSGGSDASGGTDNSTGGTDQPGDGGEDASGGSNSSSGGSNSSSGGTVSKGEKNGVYGLATGGGGCGCRVGARSQTGALGMASVVTVLLAMARRRRRQNGESLVGGAS
jgi:hypothetical protein